MATLVLIRGLPGSGKTTLAAGLSRVDGLTRRCAADDWMLDDAGHYKFDPSKLRAAHEACQAAVSDSLRERRNCIVHNTFSQKWEMAPYLATAVLCGATVEVVDLFDACLTDDELAARNVHGVPVATIAAMRARWEK